MPRGNFTELNDTWEWDGARWRRFEPKNRPAPRFSPRMAYDFVKQRVILFGGAALGGVRAVPTLFNDTWSWDGRDWTKLSPRNVPPARFAQCLEADILRKRIVLFGGARSVRAVGFGGLPHLGDTWEWDGSNWHLKQPKVSPRARAATCLAYCLLSRRVMLFGGSPSGGIFHDTWAWDGTKWTEFTNLATRPSARAAHGMALDPATGRVLLHGGDQGWTQLTDTWAWNGKTWARISTVATPPKRHGQNLTTDFATGKPLLFGGDNSSGEQRRGTWLFSGNDWKKVHEWVAPRNYTGAYVAYEPTRDRILVVRPRHFGRQSNTALDTWEVKDGAYRLHKTKTSPPPRTAFETVYHEALASMMLIGGTLTTSPWPTKETWLFDGTTWTEHKSKTGPGFGHAAYDSHRETVVLYRGGPRIETWEWHVKTGWVLKTPKTRPLSGELAYDPVRRRSVMYSGGATGDARFNVVWEWDGNDWTPIKPTTVPAPRIVFSLTYHPVLRGVVMYGGSFVVPPTVPAKPVDTWIWNGKDWKKLAANPLPRGGGGVYDSGRQRLVVVSPAIGSWSPGGEASAYVGSTWELSFKRLSASQLYPRPGESLWLNAYLPGQASAPFFLGLSDSRRPGIPLRKDSLGATEMLPLAPTPLLFGTLTGRLLDAQGKAGFLLAVPKIPALIGAEAWAAGFALGPKGVSQITNEVQLRVVH